MAKFVKISLIVLFSLVTGMIIGRNWGEAWIPKWNPEIGPDSLIEIFSAVVIGIFLHRAFQKGVTSSRVEQDMLINSLKESLTYLREVRHEFRACYTAQLPLGSIQPNIIPKLRYVSNNLTATKELLECLGYDEYKAKTEEIHQNVVIYKQILTADDPDKIFNGWHSTKHDNSYRSITSDTHKLIIDINRR